MSNKQNASAKTSSNDMNVEKANIQQWFANNANDDISKQSMLFKWLRHDHMTVLNDKTVELARANYAIPTNNITIIIS